MNWESRPPEIEGSGYQIRSMHHLVWKIWMVTWWKSQRECLPVAVSEILVLAVCRTAFEYAVYSHIYTGIKIIIGFRLQRPSLQAKWPQAWQRQTGWVDRGRRRSEGPVITVTLSYISSISSDSNDLFLPYQANRGWHVKQTMPVASVPGKGQCI